MNSILDTVKLFFYERFSNPLVTSFCISWSIWNYRFFMVIFSGESIRSKTFELEELYLAPTKFFWFDFKLLECIPASYSTGFLYPLATALIYIYLVPLVSRTVILHHYATANRTKREILEAQNEQVIDSKEARELTLRAVSLEEENEKFRSSSRSEVKAYRSQLDELETIHNSKIDALTRHNTRLKDQLEAAMSEGKRIREELELLKLLPNKHSEESRKEDDNYDDQFIQDVLVDTLTEIAESDHISLDRVKALDKFDKIYKEHIIDNLLDNKYITKNGNSATGYRYTATSQGRQYLIRKRQNGG